MYALLEDCIKTGGDILMDYYAQNQDLVIREKVDQSPITEADMQVHKFLCKSLVKIQDIPICSEEEPVDFKIRKKWDEFWLIDPLDGTKEFINHIDEFCICIALIKNHRPVIGAIYAPALNEFYYAEDKQGFAYNGPKKTTMKKEHPIVVLSRFHQCKLTQDFIAMNNLSHTMVMGSALKFGRLAIGEVDIYPRFQGSSEWDIAAGDLIVHEAKGEVIDLQTIQAPLYNKPSIRNNFFIGLNSSISFSSLNYLGVSQ